MNIQSDHRVHICPDCASSDWFVDKQLLLQTCRNCGYVIEEFPSCIPNEIICQVCGAGNWSFNRRVDRVICGNCGQIISDTHNLERKYLPNLDNCNPKKKKPIL